MVLQKKAKELGDELATCQSDLANLRRKFSSVQSERDGKQRELEKKTASEQQIMVGYMLFYGFCII